MSDRPTGVPLFYDEIFIGMISGSIFGDRERSRSIRALTGGQTIRVRLE